MDPSRDLDRIVSELNARPEADGDESSDTAILDRWLSTLARQGWQRSAAGAGRAGVPPTRRRREEY